MLKDEQRAAHSNYLYLLLRLKALNKNSKEIAGLTDTIHQIKASMTEPEISWVEKQIQEAFKSDD